MTLNPNVFRDYDIRAVVPIELDEEGIKRLALALVYHFKPKSVAVGRDMRLTSPQLSKAFINTLLDAGVNVVDLGLIATDMLYYSAGAYREDLCVTISASHNPPQYNGAKIVKRGAVAVSGDSGIYDLRDLAVSKKDLRPAPGRKGKLTKRNLVAAWVNHVLGFIKLKNLKPFKLVVDAGNGMAGYFMPAFEKILPFKVDRLYYKLDGRFPNHTPNPIKPENLKVIIDKVKTGKFAAGLAFDGDGDRVFLIDETGRIVSGTIMTAIIAENLLTSHPNDKILYNAVVGRVVPQVVKKLGGKAVRVRVGHTLIKEAMRRENGLFCGEHSGHYYFRDNFYADSAIIAALLVLELMSQKNLKLSQLVKAYDRYPSSGEINFTVPDKDRVLKALAKKHQDSAQKIDWLDGVSIWYPDWWANIRPSNTESLLRLNLEADDQKILEEKTALFIADIKK